VTHRPARCRLVAHQTDLRGRGPDKSDLRLGADLRELGVLGEEAVPRMDRIRARDLRRGNDARDVEIAFPRRRWPETYVVVSEPHVQRLAVGLGIHGAGLDPELARRA